ncbi:MAG: pyridoxamine 5'-phosphate oxidase family protein [bacterium]
MSEFTVAEILEAIRRHLEARHVITFATSHDDRPWAASAFYVTRDVDLFTCQRKDARTLAQMLANPRTAFTVDDRKVEAWLQGAGTADMLAGEEDAWARDALQQAAPEFKRHFTNLEYPTLVIHPDLLTFADRANGIYPRQQLVLRDGEWRFGE